MNTDPADEPVTDWLDFLRRADHGEKIDLNDLSDGDVLLVQTSNTCYRLVLTDARERWVEVEPNRPDRLRGRMRLMGCTYGMSSTIAPDALFCGGNLELRQITEDHDLTHSTSAIRKVMLIHQRNDRNASAAAP